MVTIDERTPNDRWISILTAAVLSLAGLLAMLQRTGHGLSGVTMCVSRGLFGLECPGCGLTRSFVALAGGEFSRAVAFNPLGPVLFAAAAGLLINHSLVPRQSARAALDAMILLVSAGSILLRGAAFYAL